MSAIISMDAEANAFAMELLMPWDWLMRDIAEMGGVDIEDDTKVKKLAARYRVSLQVMTLRLGQMLSALSLSFLQEGEKD